MRRPKPALALVTLLAAHLTAPVAAAQEASDQGIRTETPSGFPVPRFVSFKYADTNCRTGPSFQHPVAVTYVKAGTPVLVVAETIDHWRKVRDADGAECWAHQTTLSAPTHVITFEETVLYARPDAKAPVAARLGPRVLARIEKDGAGWARLSAGGARGWTETADLWGAGTPPLN